MRPNNQTDLFWVALRDPAATADWEPARWDTLVRMARAADVLGRLGVILRQQGLLERVPPGPRNHLISAAVVAAKHAAIMRWEVSRVRAALADLEVPVVLLKGGAYVMAELPPARGRFFSDLDILVPKSEIGRVESTLLSNGWVTAEVHPYDERYYRRWMHELPPLVHARRRTTLDVHHTILPETGRLHPDPQKLLDALEPLGDGVLHVLSPADMVLHSAAHLFQDGELRGGARDLVDLDDLLRHYGCGEGFWRGLVPRAEEMDLIRPLYYALHFAARFLHTPIPDDVLRAAGARGPGWPSGSLMDALVARAMRPDHPGTRPLGAASARWMLYVRSHWLRMPPLMLASHLARKSLRRWYQWREERAKA
jgi:hypothetical protein